MPKILVTCFEPFGGETINASEEVLKRLPDTIGAHSIEKLVVPCVFGEAQRLVIQKAEQTSPDMIISLGQAAGRSKVTPEYVAINFMNARIPDNRGNQPLREPIASQGPDAYFSTLPVFDMAGAIRSKELPSEVSFTAGTFVCNELYYSLLHHFNGTDTKVCFIHVPLTRDQANTDQPFMAIEDMTDAVICAIESL